MRAPKLTTDFKIKHLSSNSEVFQFRKSFVLKDPKTKKISKVGNTDIVKFKEQKLKDL